MPGQPQLLLLFIWIIASFWTKNPQTKVQAEEENPCTGHGHFAVELMQLKAQDISSEEREKSSS